MNNAITQTPSSERYGDGEIGRVEKRKERYEGERLESEKKTTILEIDEQEEKGDERGNGV